MKNRLLYLAAVGALAIPASAAAGPQSEWSLYGTLIMEVSNYKISGATAGEASNLAGKTRMTGGTTNFGFRGSSKVADDVKVFWQLENAFQLDGDAPNGIGARNTALGLEGSWGKVFAGQWDTPYKFLQLRQELYPGSIQSCVNITHVAGFNTPNTVTSGAPTAGAYAAATLKDASFHRRQGNSVHYWSPVLGGFQAKVMYSVNEAKTESSTATPQVNPSIFSGSLTYQNGPLVVAYGYEQHNDYFGLNRLLGQTTSVGGSKDTGHVLAAYLELPSKTRLTGLVEQLKYTSSIGEYKRVAWYVNAAQSFGVHRVWAGYGNADKGTRKDAAGAEITTNTQYGAKKYAVGYDYMPVKSTTFFVNVSGINNDANASYGNQGFTVAAGGDTRHISVGMIYKF